MLKPYEILIIFNMCNNRNSAHVSHHMYIKRGNTNVTWLHDRRAIEERMISEGEVSRERCQGFNIVIHKYSLNRYNEVTS